MKPSLNHTPLYVDGHKLSKNYFDRKMLGEYRQSVQKVEDLEAGDQYAKELEVLERWEKTGELGIEDYKELQDGVKTKLKEPEKKAADSYFKWIRKQDSPQFKEASRSFATHGRPLQLRDNLRNALREAGAQTAITAMANGVYGGPTQSVAAYLAFSNAAKPTAGDMKHSKGVLETLEALRLDKSSMKTEGNAIEQVHREILWKTLDNFASEALDKAKKGENPQFYLQYYELTSQNYLGRIRDVAEAGGSVRINVDPGRLSFPEKDSKGSIFRADGIVRKNRAVLQMAKVSGDIAFSFYPADQELSGTNPLMHRKFMRLDDKVLASGMNANEGSGENVDAGYIVEGPASERLNKNFLTDLEVSAKTKPEALWGENFEEKFAKSRISLSIDGISNLFDGLNEVSEIGSDVIPKGESELKGLFKKSGYDIKTFFEEDEQNVTARLLKGENVPLSETGRGAMVELLKKSHQATQSESNIQKLTKEVSAPSGEVKGSSKIYVASEPVEREALLLKAIGDAEKFVYIPGFVVTRAVSAALKARSNELEAEGKTLDVRVIADPGIYPGGSTPNSYGVKMLEDLDLPVKWARLTRTNSHDRKLHAKQLLTDKGEIVGSTNFSTQGMRRNWESSVYIELDSSDKDDRHRLEYSKHEFEEMWTHRAVGFHTVEHSEKLNRNQPAELMPFFKESSRNYVIKQTIRGIENYEKKTAKWVGEQFEKYPQLKKVVESMVEKGYSEGYTKLIVLREHLGREEYHSQLNDLFRESSRMFRDYKDPRLTESHGDLSAV